MRDNEPNKRMQALTPNKKQTATMKRRALKPKAMVIRFGSSTEIGACDNEVRFTTLELGHRAMLSSQHLFGCAE